MLEARFRCNGKIHAIRLTSKGKLAFLGHTQAELVASEAAEALGARCKCIEVLRAWRARTSKLGDLPRELRPGYSEGIDRRRGRFGRYTEKLPPPRTSLAVAKRRYDECSQNAYKRFALSDWQFEASKRMAAQLIERLYGYEADNIEVCLEDRPWIARSDAEHCLRVTLPSEWGRRVVAPGFSVIDGCMVLDIVGFGADGRTVIVAVRTVPGTVGIWEQHAAVNPDLTIEWLAACPEGLRPYVIPERKSLADEAFEHECDEDA